MFPFIETYALLQLKDVAGSLFELWKLMDTKHEEKVYFLKITSILNLSESEIVQAGALTMEIVEQVFKQDHSLRFAVCPF